MSDPNPYAAPQSELAAVAAAWVAIDSPSLRQVGLGLQWVYSGICLMLLGMICLIGCAVFSAVMPLIVGSIVVIVIGVLLQLVGPMFCLAVPRESRAMPWIVGSVVCLCVSVILAITTWAGFVLAWVFAVPAGTLANVLFLVFLRKLSLFIGRLDHARRALTVVISTVVLVAILMGTAWSASYAYYPGIGVGGADSLVVLALGIASLVVFVMYANLVNSLRKALRP
jgi:hypothetical protein